ncbi:MAG: hypothetical protein NZ529_08120 [Cytophagaceae bacterium]|nr:hypothetical protein [Cytophagaceae bacterium]MDW8456748.1 hypothetical protein [Cytophagaceae bacterium]
MDKKKLLILFISRILVCALFIFSGVAKLLPIEAFEKQLVDLGFANWCNVFYLSRSIISVEIFLGLAFLQSNYLKKIIIPSTMGLLIIFCIHLTIEIFNKGANAGNCGCMGQLIPMTPLEALIKNIFTLGLLGYMYYIYREKEKNKLHVLLILFLLTALVVYLFTPFCPCKCKPQDVYYDNINITPQVDSSVKKTIDSVASVDTMKISDNKATNVNPSSVKIAPKTTVTKKDSAAKSSSAIPENMPPKRRSEFAPFSQFSDGVRVDLDDGLKVVCLFSLDCEHCMETCKKICTLSKTTQLPPIYLLCYGEESMTENFFNTAGCRFPYRIIDPGTFFPMLGKANAPPRVTVLKNGNITADFYNYETLDVAAFEKALK